LGLDWSRLIALLKMFEKTEDFEADLKVWISWLILD
jgi:hypothetical protein